MIQLKINQAIIDKLREEGFFPDTMFAAYFAMLSLERNEIGLLDSIDDHNTSKRILLVYLDLVRKGLWEEKSEGKIMYQTTEKGKQLLATLAELEAGKEVKDDVSVWIDKWLGLFPKGVKTGGKLLRSD